jgi:hypothetical protein
MASPRFIVAALALISLASTVQGNFHIMQVEEIIGGINGDASAQAIQLRMRTTGQTVLSSASVWAADANGANRTLLLNIAGNVTNGTIIGDRILLTTAAFNNAMILGGNAGFTGDFLLTTAIPASFLSAGKLTFEADGGTTSTPGTVYWSVAWGGASYLGDNIGNAQNDADTFFGDNLGHPAPFGSALPTSSRQGVLFSGAASAPSTNNAADYTLSANPATVTKNSRVAFTVVPEPGALALLAVFGLGAFAIVRRRA